MIVDIVVRACVHGAEGLVIIIYMNKYIICHICNRPCKGNAWLQADHVNHDATFYFSS